MKVVIDTNVLVSAILRDRNPEIVITFAAVNDDIEWVASKEIIAEYKNVIRRDKFGLSDGVISEWMEILDESVFVVDAATDIEFPRDQKDAKFLECALVTDADFLITGDRDFEEAQRIVNTKIVSVSLFEKLVCDTSEV